MKMPEGWERLYVRGKMIEGHDCDDEEVQKALDLMKELVKSMELLIYFRTDSEEEFWSKEEKQAVTLLKKFRNWK
jgi:hypothetical protein